jgi:hypothetical protein
MKHVCPHCGNNFISKIEYDFYGWHTSCPVCNCSFDVDYSKVNFSSDVDRNELEKAVEDLAYSITVNAGWSIDTHGGYYSLAEKENLELIICVNKYKDNDVPKGAFAVYIEIQDNDIDEVVDSWWEETKSLDITELQNLLTELLLSKWWE